MVGLLDHRNLHVSLGQGFDGGDSSETRDLTVSVGFVSTECFCIIHLVLAFFGSFADDIHLNILWEVVAYSEFDSSAVRITDREVVVPLGLQPFLRLFCGDVHGGVVLMWAQDFASRAFSDAGGVGDFRLTGDIFLGGDVGPTGDFFLEDKTAGQFAHVPDSGERRPP